MDKDSLLGHQLQPLVAGLGTVWLVLDCRVELAPCGCHQMVCKCCDHCSKTLHEEPVSALEQVNIWREKQGEGSLFMHTLHTPSIDACNTHDHHSSYGGRKVEGEGVRRYLLSHRATEMRM